LQEGVVDDVLQEGVVDDVLQEGVVDQGCAVAPHHERIASVAGLRRRRVFNQRSQEGSRLDGRRVEMTE
jgi:hypothetical protein